MKQTRGSFSLPFGIMLLLLLVGGSIVIRALTQKVATPKESVTVMAQTVILPPYSERVKKATDKTQRLTIGDALLKKDMPAYAALNYKQASDLDSGSRDAAYGWAYATLQANKDNVTSDVMASLHTAIDRIDKIDPYFEPMLRLKLWMAEVEGKQDVASAVKERMQLLKLNMN